MSTTTTESTEPKDSESSSPSDVCACGHTRPRHWQRLGGACLRETCECKDFRESECSQACSEQHTYSSGCMLRAYGPAAATEPPMTAEEEEQAPEDPYEGEQGNCATGASEEALAMFERLKAKAQEIKAETTHRPPYAVAYSVSGTAYEALLPGDCRVEAIDGALVIRHPKPVNGIVTVSPVGRAS